MQLRGGQRAFVLFDRSLFEASDELQYRHFLREIESKGRLTRYFLPESNYTLCKLKSKRTANVAMLVMSWLTDETNDKLQSVNFLRQVLSYAANLCEVERIPVLLAGSFRLSLGDIKQVIYSEFDGFSCYGYQPDKPRRAQRQCSVYVSCPPLQLDDVKPLIGGKIKVPASTKHLGNSWRNPEDAFYWDPVFAAMTTSHITSSTVSSMTSPRALTPPLSQSTLNNTRQTAVEQEVRVESAEETLRVLLMESDRIREMVSEAESKTRSWLEAKTAQAPGADDPPSDDEEQPRQSLDNDDEGRKTTRVAITRQSHSFRPSSSDDMEGLRHGRRRHDDDHDDFSGCVGGSGCDCGGGNTVATPGESNEKIGSHKQPSYVELYDERLIEKNMNCYIQ